MSKLKFIPIDRLWNLKKDSISQASVQQEKKFNNAQTATAAGGSAINTSLFVQNAMQVCLEITQSLWVIEYIIFIL